MSKIQLQLPKNHFLNLKKRVLEDLKKNEEKLVKAGVDVKISKRSPSHSQMAGVLKCFFTENAKKTPKYIVFTSIESTIISRAFSKKADGRGVDIEILDQILMYIENSVQTSFLEYLEVKSTNELEKYVCLEHKEKFGNLTDLLYLYNYPSILPKRLEVILKSIEVNHEFQKVIDLSLLKNGKVTLVLADGEGKKELSFYVEENGKKQKITVLKAIWLIFFSIPLNAKATAVSTLNRISMGKLYTDANTSTSLIGYIGLGFIITGFLFYLSLDPITQEPPSPITENIQIGSFYDFIVDSMSRNFSDKIEINNCLPFYMHQNITIDRDSNNDLNIVLTTDGKLNLHFPPETYGFQYKINKIYLYKPNNKESSYSNIKFPELIAKTPGLMLENDIIYFEKRGLNLGTGFLLGNDLPPIESAFFTFVKKIIDKSIIIDNSDDNSNIKSDNLDTLIVLSSNDSTRFSSPGWESYLREGLMKKITTKEVKVNSIKRNYQLPVPFYTPSIDLKNIIVCKGTKYLLFIHLDIPMYSYDHCLVVPIIIS